MLIPTSKGKKLIYPGRGFLTPASRKKLPSQKKLFTDLSAAYAEVPAHRHAELSGAPDDVAAGTRARDRLLSGQPSGLSTDPLEGALLWWLLSPTWEDAFAGTPKVLTASKRLAGKIASSWVAAGGPAAAVDALVASWSLSIGYGGEIARLETPTGHGLSSFFHYEGRPFPTFAALQALRLLFATIDEGGYAGAVDAVRAAWPTLQPAARAALVFLVPTEEELALELVDHMESEPGGEWPRWAPLVSWSLTRPDAFERLEARSHGIWGADASMGFACLERAPEVLGEARRRVMLRHKYAIEPAE